MSLIRDVRSVRVVPSMTVALTEHAQDGTRAIEIRRETRNGRLLHVTIFDHELDDLLDAIAELGEELEADGRAA